MYTNYARWFCKETTGHDRVWPQGYNDVCPVCGNEIALDERILVTNDDVVYHYGCYRGRKPRFRHHVVT